MFLLFSELGLQPFILLYQFLYILGSSFADFAEFRRQRLGILIFEMHLELRQLKLFP